jgi:ABC-type enterochelin transport system substrate-binding protein
LENDGKFTNNIEKVAFKLNDVGMVTDAVWEDIDNDSKDLIVVGDWMAKIFKILAEDWPNINLTLRNIRILECS